MDDSIVPTGMYAQTSLQLFNQLQRNDWRAEQLRRIAGGYELATRLFAARIEVCGKSFLAHVIGAASILDAISAPPDLVTAGLLHNVYRNGDFGDYRRKITPARRRRVSDAIGNTAEQYVYRFATRRWTPADLREARAQLGDMPELDRHVLLLYVAEQLEKHLDLEILYSHGYEERCRHYRENGPLLVEIARELGYPVLSGWLQEALRATLDSGVPGELRSRDPRRFSWLCVPESCRGKRSIPALLAVARRIRRLLRHRQRHSMHRGVKGG